jgi:hypothetical protein
MAPKKRRFDDAFFAPPPRTRVLRLPPLREQLSASLARGAPTPVLNDEQGLDAAYKSPSGLHLDGAGTLFVAGSRGSLIGKDWRENYLTMGVPLVAQSVGIPLPYRIEDNQRYQTLEQFMTDHGGQVKNMVGHSKGAAVVDVWKKNHTDFAGKARIYSTPYADPWGKEYLKDQLNDYNSALERKKEMQSYSTPIDGLLEGGVVSYLEDRLGLKGVTGMRERGEERIANEGDFATLLDRSATRTNHGNPLAYLGGGGPHDYHEGIARLTTGFDQPSSTRPGDADGGYRGISLPQAKAPTPPTPAPAPAPSGPVRLTE